jgi:hypothetical protein
LFCDSFEQVPRRIVLDIDDTEDRVHGGQQLALFNAYYDSRCFQPADSDGSRPVFRDDIARQSDLMSLGVPR